MARWKDARAPFIPLVLPGRNRSPVGVAGYMGPGSLTALIDALVWQLTEKAPGGEVVIWAMTILLLGGGYLWGQAEFQRYEIPSKREKTPVAE